MRWWKNDIGRDDGRMDGRIERWMGGQDGVLMRS